MAEGKDSFKLISVNEEPEGELVFHAGTCRGQEGPSTVHEEAVEQSVVAEPEPVRSDASLSDDGFEDPEEVERARQRARREEVRHRKEAEVAAAEANLKKAGSMPKSQAITIGACLVLLVVTVVYIVQTFVA